MLRPAGGGAGVARQPYCEAGQTVERRVPCGGAAPVPCTILKCLGGRTPAGSPPETAVSSAHKCPFQAMR